MRMVQQEDTEDQSTEGARNLADKHVEAQSLQETWGRTYVAKVEGVEMVDGGDSAGRSARSGVVVGTVVAAAANYTVGGQDCAIVGVGLVLGYGLVMPNSMVLWVWEEVGQVVEGYRRHHPSPSPSPSHLNFPLLQRAEVDLLALRYHPLSPHRRLHPRLMLRELLD